MIHTNMIAAAVVSILREGELCVREGGREGGRGRGREGGREGEVTDIHFTISACFNFSTVCTPLKAADEREV